MPTVDEVLFGAPQAPPKPATPAPTALVGPPPPLGTAAPTPTTVDDVLYGSIVQTAPPAPPPLPSPTTVDEVLYGSPQPAAVTGESTEAAPPPPAPTAPETPAAPKRKLREPTTLENIGWTTAGVAVPIVAGIGTGLVTANPVAGMAAGGLSSGATESLKQYYEIQQGIREHYSPGVVAWETLVGSIPGLKPEVLGAETVAKKALVRAGEGMVMGGGGATGRTRIEQGRWPTLREVAPAVALGGVLGPTVGAGVDVLGGTLAARATRQAAARAVDDASAHELWLITDAEGNHTATSDPRLASKLHKRLGGDEAGASVRYMDPDETAEYQRTILVPRLGRGEQLGETAVPPPEQLGETPVPPEPPSPVEPVRMVTRPGETIGGADEFVGPLAPEPAQTGSVADRHPVGSDVEFTPAGTRGQTDRGTVVAHHTDPTTGTVFAEVEMPNGRRDFAGDTNDIRPAEAHAIPGAAAPAPPPPRAPELGPEPPSPEAAESRAWAASPFRQVPGLSEAMTGEEIPSARPAPAERVETQRAHVQRVWGHLPQEAQDIIAYTTLEHAPEIAEGGRETQPVARTQRLGQDLVFDPERAAKQPTGTTWNAEQFASANQAIEAQTRTIQQLRAEFEADPTSARAALRLQRASTELEMSVRAYQGRTTEAGRSLNILKYQSAALDSGDPRFIREAVRVGASADDIAKVLRTPNLDEAARYRGLLRIRRPGRLQYLNTYLTQNILSGPATQERNIIGNTVPLLTQPATRPIAGAMDWARVAALGGERRVYAHEVFPMVAGYVDAIKPAAKGVYHILTTGYTPEQALNFELPHPELLPTAGPWTRGAANIVLRGLNAMDYGFRTLHEQGEFRSLAYRNARNNVLIDVAAGRIPESEMATALADRTQYYRDNPTDAMLKETRDVGARGVYQESGKVDRALMYARDNIPGGRYALWFVRTPLNILRQGVQLTPAGLLTKQGRPVALGGIGGRAGTQARAEAALGTFLMAPIAMLAARGQLTGAGPSNPAEIDAWRAQGKQPNSIKIGDHWYGYGALGPLAIPLATIANGYEAAERLQREGVTGWQEQSERIAAQVGRGLYRTMLQQSYLKGLSDIQDAVDDESGRKFQRLVANYALMAVPGSGMVRGVAQAEDPVLRQPESTAEALRLQLPVSHADIAPRIRATGEPIVSGQPGGFAGRLLLPTQVSPATDTPVRAELRRLGIPLAVPQAGKIEDVKPPRDAALAIAQAKGYAREAALEKVIGRSDWARIDDRVKTARIKQVDAAITGAIQTRARVLTKRGEPITIDALYPKQLLGEPPPAMPTGP